MVEKFQLLVTWLHCVPVCNKTEHYSGEDVGEYGVSSYYKEAQSKIERKGQEQNKLCQASSHDRVLPVPS